MQAEPKMQIGLLKNWNKWILFIGMKIIIKGFEATILHKNNYVK